MTEYLSDCHLKGDLMGLDLLLAEIAAISQKGGMRVRECIGVFRNLGADQSDFANVPFSAWFMFGWEHG